MIDYTKITQNEEVIKLLKEREEIDTKILNLDSTALVEYTLAIINEEP